MQIDKSGDKSLNSEFHTLFIEDKKEHRKLINADENLYKITPRHKLYRVYIDSFLERRKGLHNVFNELRKAGPRDKLELRISSSGGFVLEGVQFFNLILEKFADRTTAYLDNHGHSMGALVFCMAEKRVIYPYSDIMFHNYSHGSYGKGGDVKSHVEYIARTREKFFADIVVRHGFLSEQEFQEMLLGRDYWMDAKEMCQRGIATHVVLTEREVEAEEFLQRLKAKKKAEKKLKKERKAKVSQIEKPTPPKKKKKKKNT